MKLLSIAVGILSAVGTTVAASGGTATPTEPWLDVLTRTTPVYVTNLPEIQAVSGVVSIDNLPPVQPVSGTVSIGNLPLDADGAMRVSAAPPRVPIMIELLDAPAEHVQDYPLPLTVDTAGYSSVGLGVTTSTHAD